MEKIWQAVLESMRVNLSPSNFNGYFRQLRLESLQENNNRLIGEVACSNSYVKQYIEKRYLGQIADELSRITQEKCEIRLVIKEIKKEIKTDDLPLFVEKTLDPQVMQKIGLRSDFTFVNYAVSGSNQMAYAAATAVAKKPGGTYNPLFIYGGVGVGKTHLMQAIGHQQLETGETRILFCTGEEFTNDLVEAIQKKTTNQVRAKYRKAKLLLIDDVQFIAGKAGIQEEFFHTFNAVQRDGGQIVMTSDRPPAEIPKLEARLKSRFGAGLIVDVGPADLELRTAIILIKSQQRQLNLTSEWATQIAENISGLREIEGFLTKLTVDPETLSQNKIDRLLAKPITVETGTKFVTPNAAFSAISGYFGVSIAQLKGERRTRHIVWPRQILMYFLRTVMDLSLEETGKLVGGRDHTTVIHADGKVKLQMQSSALVHSQIQEIHKKLFTTSG